MPLLSPHGPPSLSPVLPCTIPHSISQQLTELRIYDSDLTLFLTFSISKIWSCNNRDDATPNFAISTCSKWTVATDSADDVTHYFPKQPNDATNDVAFFWPLELNALNFWWYARNPSLRYTKYWIGKRGPVKGKLTGYQREAQTNHASRVVTTNTANNPTCRNHWDIWNANCQMKSAQNWNATPRTESSIFLAKWWRCPTHCSS